VPDELTRIPTEGSIHSISKRSHYLTPNWGTIPTLIKILIAVAAIFVVLAVIVALQPSEFRVARSTTISAPASTVFAQVIDFHKWEAWNPWGKIDPAMKQTYEGAPAGTGAIYTWAGNNEVGEGRMAIIESRPSELIRVKLEFFKPFAATNTAEFTFKPGANQTVVTWSMFGEKNFMAKAIHLFMNMDKMIGGQFEKGLAEMKSVVEPSPKQ
jgi:Polyketide cyclase / dehydrase and lipid transport